MLKSLGLWKTTYEEKQKVCLDVEGESVGQRRVNEEDTLTADAAAPTGKDMALVKHEENSLSHSAPDTENAGTLSPLEEGYGLRRRFSANNVSDQVRCGCLCHIYTIECPF
jgi:hypothetical protein